MKLPLRPSLPLSLPVCVLVVASVLAPPPAVAQVSDEVLWYHGNDGYHDWLYALEDGVLAAGAAALVVSDVWPADLDPYRVVFLGANGTAFTVDQTNDLADFVGRGGLVVLVTDREDFAWDASVVFNALLTDLGVASAFTGGDYDEHCAHPATVTAPSHPFLDGVTDVYYAFSGDIAANGSGVELLQGISGQELLVQEGPFVLSSDLAIFVGSCDEVVHNVTLHGNLFSAWCDMDGDGQDKEICGGIDCDDDDAAVGGPTLWYEDADGDSFGNGAVFTEACGAPADFVADDSDCDDTNPNVHPGADEVHDGLDNGCDDLVDEGVLPYDALLITEFLKDPAAVSNSDGEWIEVYNNTALGMDLFGLVVSDLDGDSFTVETSLPLAAGEHAVLGVDADVAVNGGVAVDYEYSGLTLANGPDDEIVLTHGGVELDHVYYDAVDWPDTAGAAASLDPSEHDPDQNDDPSHWCDAPDPWGPNTDLGSPGEMNPPCCSDADGDGYLDEACGGDDCDDGDPDVAPGTVEAACDDGVDNDCDGVIDGDDPDCDGGDDDDSTGDDDDSTGDDDDSTGDDDDTSGDDDDAGGDDDDDDDATPPGGDCRCQSHPAATAPAARALLGLALVGTALLRRRSR